MTEAIERPKFLRSFFEALADRADHKTLLRGFAVPASVAIIAAAAAYALPSAFWADENWSVATTVYTGLLTFNGLILALSWSAFSKIYEIVSAPKFASFLRRNKLLGKYIVTVTFIHGLQLLAVVASAVGLFVVLVDVIWPWLDRAILGVMLFFSIYAIQQAAASVTIMHDLVWYKAAFDEHHEAGGGDNVVGMNRNGQG